MIPHLIAVALHAATGPACTGTPCAGTPVTAPAANWPAVSTTGRMVLEIGGDLFIRDAGKLFRVTSGSALDLQPAWTADGNTIVFASDRAGQMDLWQIGVNAVHAPVGEALRLTYSPLPDTEPAVARDGRIVFVRGAGDAADLWLRDRAGDETQLTTSAGADRSPSIAPDGSRIAFTAMRGAQRQLRSMGIDGANDRAILDDQAADYPAWSPRGDRIAFTTPGSRGVIMITDTAGSYTTRISRHRGRPVWLPGGDSLIVAELQPDGPGYNGDPERIRDRDAQRQAMFAGRFWPIAVPEPPDSGNTAIAVSLPFSAERAVEEVERVWARVRDLYFAADMHAERAAWDALLPGFRAAAQKTTAQEELDRVLHNMIERRPLARREAAGRAGVSSAHPLATEAGLEILRRGGNVVDAAVAVSFALGVVEPDASGIGGYGQMLIFTKGMDDPALIEFMTRVPEEAALSNTALAAPDLHDAALAMVPGTVDGMHRAWQRFGSGKVSWAELIEPAIRFAETGFVLDDALPTTLRRERDRLAEHEGSRALFFRNGQPLAAGDTFRNPDLAWTLKQIANDGADAFYRGEVARRIIADLRDRGSVMSLRDLDRYFAQWREPTFTTYRGHSVYGSTPPVSGGALLSAQLNLLEHFERPRRVTSDAATLHAMIEAWKLAPRRRIADPGLWPVDITASLSKDTAAARWRCYYDPTRAVPQRDINDNAGSCPGARRAASESHECDVSDLDRVCRSTGTTAFAVADADGNMVAVTQTLGTWGGNFYVTPGLGFLYNDKLRSYGTNPEAFGARLPFARVGSTISPTLVFRGMGGSKKPLLAAGAAGNAWINSAVYQIVTGVIDAGLGPQQALELPRFLPGTQTQANGRPEAVIQIEAGFSPDVLRALEKMGHRFNVISLPGELRMGYGAAVMIDGGRVRAGGDPRRSGAGGAVR